MDETLILTSKDLNMMGRRKYCDDLNFKDFMLSTKKFYEASYVLFLDDRTPRIITLKSRYK